MIVRLTEVGERAQRASVFADRADVEAMAQDMPDSFLMCREMSHQWRPASARIGSDGVIARTLECGRCTAQRVQELSPRGHVLSSHYVYPEGYLAVNIGRIAGDGRDALRLASVMRHIDGQSITGPARRRRKAG